MSGLGIGILFREFSRHGRLLGKADDPSNSATAGLTENDGRGSNGGVWEWSSTLLDTHDGFEGTTIFPGYSSDFFDGKHQVVVCHFTFDVR